MSREDCLNRLRCAAPAILPSLLLCDFGNLQREVERLTEAGVPALHLDVMDGHFVPNLTYGMPIVESLRRITNLPLDVHLMIDEPQRFLRQFVDAGADLLTVHVEAVADPAALLGQIRQMGVGAGIALNPDTPLTQLDGCYHDCDLVLVMSVPAGFGGQSFHTSALDKLRQVRELVRPEVLLEVDGGINAKTIGDCARAGAQLFVAGSAVFKTANYGQAVRQLKSLAMAPR